MKNRIQDIDNEIQNNISEIKDVAYREGGFENWYNNLSNMRSDIQNKYIRFKSILGTYRRKKNVDTQGLFVDHHIISYFEPLKYRRIGWGGYLRSPADQIRVLADNLAKYETRFIYVPIPNKGMVYPEKIGISYANIMKPYPSQYKLLLDLLSDGIEVINVFPYFEKHREQNFLFQSADHNLSSFGAKVVADCVAEYLLKTTTIEESKRLFREEIYKQNNHHYEEPTFVVLESNNCGCRNPYICNDKCSEIAIFGDCNLQAYEDMGAGIAANISYRLSVPLFNVGRKLLFSNNDDRIDIKDIEILREKQIVIYVAFASAGFVRSSEAWRKRCFIPLSWNKLKLEV